MPQLRTYFRSTALIVNDNSETYHLGATDMTVLIRRINLCTQINPSGSVTFTLGSITLFEYINQDPTNPLYQNLSWDPYLLLAAGENLILTGGNASAQLIMGGYWSTWDQL